MRQGDVLDFYNMVTGEKRAKVAQKLGQLQPVIAAFPRECMGQLAFSGPTQPSSLIAAGLLIASRAVVSMREASDENPTVGVVLDTAVGPGLVPEQIGGSALNHSVTQVFDLNRTSNQFVFRKNIVRNRAANSRGPRGPVGPLGNPSWTPCTHPGQGMRCSNRASTMYSG